MAGRGILYSVYLFRKKQYWHTWCLYDCVLWVVHFVHNQTVFKALIA